jgi:hypothetical protein
MRKWQEEEIEKTEKLKFTKISYETLEDLERYIKEYLERKAVSESDRKLLESFLDDNNQGRPNFIEKRNIRPFTSSDFETPPPVPPPVAKCSFCNNSATQFLCSVCFERVNELNRNFSELSTSFSNLARKEYSFKQKLTNWIQLLTNRPA